MASDKPGFGDMTLAEHLRRIAEDLSRTPTLRAPDTSGHLEHLRRELQAVAMYCEGKVLVPISRRGSKWGPGNVLSYINSRAANVTAHGFTETEADANLQALIDGKEAPR